MIGRIHDAELRADASRTIDRLFLPGGGETASTFRIEEITARVLALSEASVNSISAALLADFSRRHADLEMVLSERAAAALMPNRASLTHQQRVVLGAAFTAEFATEGAALCNPSAVAHPDQGGLEPGQLRVAVGLRSIGEGHLSSISFAEAIIGPDDSWEFLLRSTPLVQGSIDDQVAAATQPTYVARFGDSTALSQRVLLPVAAEENHGMEDARFVRFLEDDGTFDYRATYTAYDGRDIAPKLIHSPDLKTFTVSRMTGRAARNKGMALFPRRIGGVHLALGRADGANISLARSDDGATWSDAGKVYGPTEPWEIVQTGNCGSPIETPQGWIVLIHGVGPMRVYSLGALLLDLDDPTQVLKRTLLPLLQPDDNTRDGYVPNVVYSCGGILQRDRIWIPIGIGDQRIGVYSVGVDELIGSMTP